MESRGRIEDILEGGKESRGRIVDILEGGNER